MVGFLPQGNGLMSGPQTLTNRIISNPFVGQFAQDPAMTTQANGGFNPYGAGNGSIGNGGQTALPANVPVGGGGGSAYTVGVLNSLQPLGVTPQQYPHMNAPAAPPPQNGGLGGLASNPVAMNAVQGSLYQYQGGPRGDRGSTGNVMYNPALHDPNSWLYKTFSAAGIDPNKAFQPQYANGNPILPGSKEANMLGAYQQDYNALRMPGASNNLGVPFSGNGGQALGQVAGAANPMQTVIPMQNMAKTVQGATFQPAMGYQPPSTGGMVQPPSPAPFPGPLPVLAGPPRTPQKPVAMPAHYMGIGQGAPRNY